MLYCCDRALYVGCMAEKLPPSQPPNRKTQQPRRADRLVYESGARKALKRSHPTVPGADGKQHLYLNAALPRDHRTGEVVAPLERAVCVEKNRCGHAYSHLRLNGTSICRECAIDDAEALVAECAEYLKEGETPRQRMDRDHKDALMLMELLVAEKTKVKALKEARHDR